MNSDVQQISYWAHMLDEAMTDKTLSEASYEDFAFLKKSINLDEFKLNCTLYGIDQKEVIRNIKVFSENGKYCLAFDHFYWFDENGNEIDPPRLINSNFCCPYQMITSLRGAPQTIYGSFDCYCCPSLKTLAGAPYIVTGTFDCGKCKSLTSLKGAPKRIDGSFSCFMCDSLTSLEGAPEKIGVNFSCHSCKSLTSLKGSPTHINGYFHMAHCTQLTSLNGGPQYVDGYFDCGNCTSLTSLSGAPREVGGSFYYSGCTSLTSLTGAPIKIGRKVEHHRTHIDDEQYENYIEFLNHPTPEHIDNSGHYKP